MMTEIEKIKGSERDGESRPLAVILRDVTP